VTRRVSFDRAISLGSFQHEHNDQERRHSHNGPGSRPRNVYRRFGVNPGGVMDRAAVRLINALLANDENAAVS
jgi:hypothetical protein